MHRVSVLGEPSIIVSSHLTETIVEETLAAINCSAYVIVTDSTVKQLHLNNLHDAFIRKLAQNQRILNFAISPGEIHKTRRTKEIIEDFMLENKCTRDTCLIALGGGVIGDLVGFTAATFMRGIPIIQVPTTLLAMVDSSVGGKTGLDTSHGKNLIGAFHQPKRIFIDIQYLKTLPKREFVNGLAEVIKTAAIWREKDFEMLENHSNKILKLIGNDSDAVDDLESEKMLLDVILGSIQVKAHVVTIDEKETGLRGLLNFGHTVGHAIEAIMYPEMLHGECVSIGMVQEAEISRNLGILNNVSVGRLIRCLKSYGLPVSLEDGIVKERCPNKTCAVNELMEFMKVDKKNKGDQKRIVLLSSIGKTHEPRASFVQDDVIRNVISPAMQIIPPALEKDTIIKLNVPGSKSISNRALLMAALGNGPCRLRGLLHSDDVQVMLNALQKLVGITFEWEDFGETLYIHGGGGKLNLPENEIYLGNAGTASRFLTTVCALLNIPKNSNGDKKSTIITGNSRMKQRPIGPLVTALSANGCNIQYVENEGSLPLEIDALGLKGGNINLSASISSQFVSSILISAPYATESVTLDLTGDSVISQPYIDMTIEMMKSFGIFVERIKGTNKYLIPKGVYKNPKEYLIEADASSATYPLAFAAITGKTVSVQNIGRKSLQGDSEFAIKVLRVMGCSVEQTDTTTVVTGPEVLKPISNIDMETMTDAFMTAAVLAAVAQDGVDNITRITGIANQRLKECDRIAAMIAQLSRFGVQASELPDGIQIHGLNRNELQIPSPNGVLCYDDHRIAMSFSVLACAFSPDTPSAIITEKKCVEKTWPSWWDAFTSILGAGLIGIDMHPSKLNESFNRKKCVDFDTSSIVIIGMRGAGKTYFGKIAAKHLGYAFIDMDQIFESETNLKIKDYLSKNSWEEFRLLEVDLLCRTLENNRNKTVISCGGGIVETERGRNCLKSVKGEVIHISRSIESIEEYLNIDKTRPLYGEDLRACWNRRRALYQNCSTLEFVYISPPSADNSSWDRLEYKFEDYLDFTLKRKPFHPPSTENCSYFVSLTFPDLSNSLDLIPDIIEGANAIELRIDMLKSHDVDFVGQQVALLRTQSSIPILFTVRTKSQGGNFADENFDQMLELLSFGIKWGCEYIDVEFKAPFKRFDNLKNNKRGSLLIASYHDCKGHISWHSMDSSLKAEINVRSIYKDLCEHGDIIKLIGKAKDLNDNFAVKMFVDENYTDKPIIAMLMGRLGQLSRCLNTFLTPVTHKLIPTPAAPGQLTIQEINIVRTGMGLIQKREFFLCGTPISTSPSPTLHNAGFKCLGLPHSYKLIETQDWQDVKREIEKPINFGASVTIPLKIDVLRNCLTSENVSVSALSIGALNTLAKKDDGRITGDNTDWLGIKNSITKRKTFKKQELNDSKIAGVILGAGGTSRAAIFALKELGISCIRVWNRTFEKAKKLCDEAGVGCNAVQDLSDVLQGDMQFVIIGCIPANAQSTLDLPMMFGTNPSAAINGIVVEMAYRPRITPLLEAAVGWEKVDGFEVLCEQGFEQFERWTGLKAPRITMRNAVMSADLKS